MNDQLIKSIKGQQEVFPNNDLCIHEMIEQQADLTPSHLAVLFKKHKLTYKDLNERANQLAHYLIDYGIKKEEPVAICMDRSIEMVVVLLGILKAGGAYVPLDANNPIERINVLLEELENPLIISSFAKESIVSKANSKKLLYIEEEVWKSKHKHNPRINRDIDSLMYIIYTSGSTGKPKGVMNVHKALNNRLQWMQKAFQLTSNDRVLQKTPIGFDVSVWEFFWPLMYGATIVVAEPDGHKDPDYLLETIVDFKVTTVHFVPSMLQIFLENLETKEELPLKRVICSGEALKKSTTDLFYSKLKEHELFNLYGPTEAAIDVTYWKCLKNTETIVPIGYPISNIELYILNKKNHSVEVGEVGELYIGGVGLARGYFKEDQLTAERFIQHPDYKGERIYKTGDLCRIQADGAIEYIGRTDFQVKLNGVRVELGEIETVIEEHPSIKQCVTSAIQIGDQQSLVSYVTKNNSENWDEKKLREDLAKYLPQHMIPTFIVGLNEFPISPNGKIDRKLLPDPTRSNQLIEKSVFSETENIIASLWKEYLNLTTVGKDISFMSLGGNSLFAASIAGRLKKTFTIPIKIDVIFKFPTIKQLANYINQQTQEKSLISKKSEERKIEDELSYAQERIWFSNELEGINALYNLPSYVEIDGVISLMSFEKSLANIVNENEVLQTNFINLDGKAKRVLNGRQAPQLKFVDYSNISIEKAEKQSVIDMRKDASIAYDLSTDCLYRFCMYKIAKDKYRFYYNFHHIIFDGWSESLFLNQLFKDYINNTAPKKHEPGERRTYSDYVGAQQVLMSSEQFDNQLTYWKKKLNHEIQDIKLFADQDNSSKRDMKGETYSFTISSLHKERLEEICRKNNATLFMGMLALYKIAIYRLSNEEDVSIGVPVAGRNQEDEDIIGMFVNTTVIRNKLTKDMNFIEVLKDIKTTTLEALSNSEVPFEKIVETIKPNRAVTQNPFFEYMFAFQNFPQYKKVINAISIQKPVQLSNDTSKFDLTFFVELEEELLCRLEYRTGVFTQDSIERFSKILRQLLEGVLLNYEIPVENLPLLNKEEENVLIYKLNATEREFPDVCLHELFEKQVTKMPYSTAAVYLEDTLTYLELDEKSNQLAHLLIEKGIIPDTPIGLRMDRSLDMIVGILGILKAGGAYLPIDSDTPVERVRNILHDAKSPLFIVDQSFALLTNDEFEVLNYKLNKTNLSHYPFYKPEVDLTTSNLVSVYYTSGSTGKPKGVCSTHMGWVNRISWMQNKHNLQPGEASLQKTTLTFDDSAIEIFWPLMVGGMIALIPPGDHKDPTSIIQYAIKHNVTLLQFVPSMLDMVLHQVDEDIKSNLTNLRVVISSGEALKNETVNEFYKKLPGTLFNTWGATEVSIDSTCFDTEQTIHNENVKAITSIGKPIDNNRIYILDNFLKPVPIGVAGDLYIAGIGLAREYLNNPQKTKESFIPDPFFENELMYYTGDRGYYSPDGNIMFLGREDNQIKIRGMRVELGEIENRIRAIEGVKECVVLLKKFESVSHLAAYITSDDAAIDLKSIKNQLQQDLLEYMVPSYYVKLDSLFYTSSGKVDRNNLPDPSAENLLINAEYTLPQNKTEHRVLEIWKEKLKVDQIGTNDNFFELGGHSLLAVQIISKINEEFSISLPLKELFNNPSITGICNLIHNSKSNKVFTQNQNFFAEIDRSNGVALSDAQKRIWFLEQLNPGSKYNMPLVLTINGEVSITRLKKAINTLVQRHEALRTTFLHHQGSPMQYVNEYSEFDLNIIEDSSKGLQDFINEETQRVFNLSKGPLVRATLIRRSINDVLILTFHHIICDGWSLKIIKDELVQLYNEKQLSKKVVQYPNYAVLQKEFETTEESRTQLSYWKKNLNGSLPLLQLPTDVTNNLTENNTLKQQLNQELSNKVKQFSKEQKATPFMVILGAFTALLSRLSSQDDLIVGTPIVNRNNIELETAVGIFLNTLPLRTRFPQDLTFIDHLNQIKKTVLSAFANQDVPFEKIVEHIQPERNLNRNPLFDVLINYRNFEEEKSYKMDNLDVSEIEVEEIQSKFLMTLYIQETHSDFYINLSYQNNLFSKKRMDEFLNQLIQVLETSISMSETKINDCSLVTKKAALLLPDPSEIIEKKEFPRITTMIKEWAINTPEKIAIEEPENCYSYSELLKDFQSTSSKLLSEKINPGEVVAVYGNRSYKTIVSVLGILEIDAIFLNIDESIPPYRLKEMLTQSNASHILLTTTIDKTLQNVLDDLQINKIFINSFEENQTLLKIDRPLNEQNSNEAAYIFFTSGTTGKPKGILGTHDGLSHFLDWQRREFHVSPEDRFAQLTNITFDVYLRDAFLPLVSGSTLCIPESSTNVLNFLQSENITIFHTVPSLSKIWIDSSESDTLRSMTALRHIFFAGEALSQEVIGAWNKFTSAELISLYGQTETTLAKSYQRVPAAEKVDYMPIGNSLPDTQIFLLNKSNKIAGIGETGEIIVRTPYQTKGYLDSKIKTFSHNPFISDPSAEFFRTGDIGRYLPTGNIEVLGRNDEEIKIRGVRINKKEITSIIKKIEGIQECVILEEKQQSQTILKAFLVFEKEMINTEKIRHQLLNELPMAMIPNQFIPLSQIPVTKNGKLDRNKLLSFQSMPLIDKSLEELPFENQILEIWQDLLPLCTVNKSDNFFELGGHSLLIVKMLAIIKERLGIDLNLRDVFYNPSVLTLSSFIANKGFTEPSTTIRKIERVKIQLH